MLQRRPRPRSSLRSARSSRRLTFDPRAALPSADPAAPGSSIESNHGRGVERNRGRPAGPGVQGRRRRRRGDRPARRRGRDLRLPRPERRRQVDHRAHADDAAAPDLRHRDRGRVRHRPPGPAGAEGDRRGAAGGGARPDPDRPRAPAAADGAPCCAARGARGARAGAARARGPDRGRRPQGADVLRRHEAPARPGAGARPPPADPVPGRADDRPRPAVAERAVAGGRPAREGGRCHGLPDHAVPRGGRRALRPGRDHRPGQDRRRGIARRAEGLDRPADRRRRPE